MGFPKTATTTLQKTFFSTLTGVTYHGMHGGQDTDQSLRLVLSDCWTKFHDGFSYSKELTSWIDHVRGAKSENLLISDETLTYWKSPRHSEASRWHTLYNPSIDIPRSGSHPVNEFLSLIQKGLPYGSKLRGIITLRNQTDLLGSLAAQTGKSDPNFLERVLRTEDPSLAFFRIVKDLQKTLGKENLLVLFYEDGIESNSKKIAQFVSAESAQELDENHVRLNVKKLGEGFWKTGPKPPKLVALAFNRISASPRGQSFLVFVKRFLPWVRSLYLMMFSKTVKISLYQKQRIQEHFRNDNNQLSELVGRDLRELGY